MDIFLLFNEYPWLFSIVVTLFGLLVGSFLNVVIYRLPIIMEREWQQECSDAFPEHHLPKPEGVFNLSLPRSACPKCGTQIKAIDNIPIISWLWLRGKCRCCSNPISIRYPLIELLTAVMSLTITLYFPASPFSIALLFFTFTLIAVTFIDLDTMLLPDQLTLPLTWFALALALFNISPVSLEDAVIGAMAGYLSLWAVYWSFKLLTGKEGMGYGDFKLLAALGAWLGWQSLPLIILLSSLVGLVFGLIQLYLRKQGIDKAFPFGPYLAIAGWVQLLWGSSITHWYYVSILGM